MSGKGKVLVLGATGGIGGEMARQLRDSGWEVRALQRRPVQSVDGRVGLRDGISWLQGDAMNRDDVMAAAGDCSVIVHAVNPPAYHRWSQLVLPMLDNSIAAACALGATIVFPGTIYNFGPDAFPVFSEQSPQHPVTRKGAIRVEMERRLLAAGHNGARVVIVRAGDYFGPQASNNWFSQGLVKQGKPVTTIRNPSKKGVGHLWSYIPDVARTMVKLLARRESLAPFASFHMEGHWDADGTRMAAAIQQVVARCTGRKPPISSIPWWLMTLASPFVEMLREMREMRYLWLEPLRMDNARLVSVLGREPHTPLDQAVETTLLGLGCIPQPAARRPEGGSTTAAPVAGRLARSVRSR